MKLEETLENPIFKKTSHRGRAYLREPIRRRHSSVFTCLCQCVWLSLRALYHFHMHQPTDDFSHFSIDKCVLPCVRVQVMQTQERPVALPHPGYHHGTSCYYHTSDSPLQAKLISPHRSEWLAFISSTLPWKSLHFCHHRPDQSTLLELASRLFSHFYFFLFWTTRRSVLNSIAFIPLKVDVLSSSIHRGH